MPRSIEVVEQLAERLLGHEVGRLLADASLQVAVVDGENLVAVCSPAPLVAAAWGAAGAARATGCFPLSRRLAPSSIRTTPNAAIIAERAILSAARYICPPASVAVISLVTARTK
jgi:hypothetical protein